MQAHTPPKNKAGCYRPAWILIAFMTVMAALNGPPAHAKAYSIGPGDVIGITIFAGGEKQYEDNLRVSDRGTLNAPFVGVFKASGLTPAQLETQLTVPLGKDFFVDPEVNIRMMEYHSLQYYISGAVGRPGEYTSNSEMTLLELIAKAEGVLPERSNVAYVMRGGGKEALRARPEEIVAKDPIKVDLQRLLDTGDLSANLALQPSDVVYIPSATALDQTKSKIYVEGEVKTPGVYDYRPGMSAMSACILAGGFSRFAAPNRARIIRQVADGINVIKINLEDVKEGRTKDVPLEPGDRVHIPETWL